MPIVQFATATGNSPNPVITLPNPPTANNVLVAGCLTTADYIGTSQDPNWNLGGSANVASPVSAGQVSQVLKRVPPGDTAAQYPFTLSLYGPGGYTSTLLLWEVALVPSIPAWGIFEFVVPSSGLYAEGNALVTPYLAVAFAAQASPTSMQALNSDWTIDGSAAFAPAYAVGAHKLFASFDIAQATLYYQNTDDNGSLIALFEPSSVAAATIGNGQFSAGALGNGAAVSGAVGSEANAAGAIGSGEYVA